jgi:hypothetical protein
MKTRPSDKFEKSDHPFDTGYWMRYDGLPKPRQREMRDGWQTCDQELAGERRAKLLIKLAGK